MTHNDPSAELSSSWLVRAYHTPISDALRGNLSARLDPRAAILSLNLPMSLGELVLDVVRRTRLWRREKVDVARELAAHFADGLATGRSVEQLTRDFGDPRQAARLIRSAKRRNRPWPWQVWHYSFRTLLVTLAACTVLYAFLAIRFYWGKPALNRNYWHEINAARHVPDSDRAWPIYRDTFFKLGKDAAQSNLIGNHGSFGPASMYWNDVMAYVDAHQDAIAEFRRGAAKSRLGFYVGSNEDLAAAKAANGYWLVPEHMETADKNEDAIAMLLYGPQETRNIARILTADAYVAANRKEGARAAADLAAMISLARQQQSEPKATLVEQLIGMAVFHHTADLLGHLLIEFPELFSDEQLVELAHRLNTYGGADTQIDMAAEEIVFEDVMQRIFTDDGHGDGRVTFAGIKVLDEYANRELLGFSGVTISKDMRVQLALRAVAPVLSIFVGSRAGMSTEYLAIIDDMIAAHQGVPWQWDVERIDQIETRIQEHARGINKLRHIVPYLLLPAVSAVFNAGERSIQIRDAAQTAIAIELWRRKHSAWPERLEQLVPELLPEVPPDRLDGQPLRYVVRDGKPLLYSLGKNRIDDGGRAKAEDSYSVIPASFVPLAKGQTVTPDPNDTYDWILWPPIREKELSDEELYPKN